MQGEPHRVDAHVFLVPGVDCVEHKGIHLGAHIVRVALCGAQLRMSTPDTSVSDCSMAKFASRAPKTCTHSTHDMTGTTDRAVYQELKKATPK